MILPLPMSQVAVRGSLVSLFVAEALGRRSGGWRTLRGDAWRAFCGACAVNRLRPDGWPRHPLIGGTAPLVAQLLVTLVDLEAAPEIYVAVMAGLALIALRSWPETAFRELI